MQLDDNARARVLAPLLVVGAPRSGTTLVQRLLLADPRCAGGQESHFLASFGPVLREFDRKRSMARPHGLACYWTRERTVSLLRDLWLEAFGPVLAARPAATLLVEKTPDHALWLDVAAELVPDARVIHVVRDSRAVVASLLRAGRAEWGRTWAPKSLEAAVSVWRRHVEAALDSPIPVRLVRYEDLLDDPRHELAAIAEFAGLGSEPIEIDDALLADSAGVGQLDGGARHFVAGGAIGTPPGEPAGFARPASEARDGWKRELGWWRERRIWTLTRGLMERLGYPRSGRERPT
jgi:hypothetical protein